MNIPEKAALKKIHLAIGSRGDVVIWRNNTGAAWQGKTSGKGSGTITLVHPRPISFGLCVGSSDLIGWTIIDGVAVFTAIEVKSAKGKPTPRQLQFLSRVRDSGGLSGIAETVEDAHGLIDDGIARFKNGQTQKRSGQDSKPLNFITPQNKDDEQSKF